MESEKIIDKKNKYDEEYAAEEKESNTPWIKEIKREGENLS